MLLSPERTISSCAHDRRMNAVTLIELLVVIAIIGLLAAIYVPLTSKAKAKARQVECVSNLRQIGYSFRLFAQEHRGRFPMGVRVRYGGTMEYVSRGDAYRHFQALSNLIDTSALVICPADRARAATNWVSLSDANLSYLVGLDARPNNSFHILAADRNITNRAVRNGRVMPVTANSVVEWSSGLHEAEGNLLFVDGHVEQADNKRLRRAIADHRDTD